MKKIAAVSVLATLGVLMSSGTAMAESPYLSSWTSLYNNATAGTSSRTGVIGSCAVCHQTRGGGDDLNAYGEQWAARPHGSATTNAAAFSAIELLNSDNDPEGYRNIEEINASAQPGWKPGATNTLYDVNNAGTGIVVASNQNPPTLTGSVYNPTDLIFRNAFESGNLTGWTSNVNDGDMIVTGVAALEGSFGLSALVNGVNPLYVQDDTPVSEWRYRGRFLFDPNGFDPGIVNNALRLRPFIAFQGTPQRRLITVVLRLLAGQYSMMVRTLLDDSTRAQTAFVNITDAPHSIQFDWRRATAPGATDGSLELWIDGVSSATLTGLRNSSAGVDYARMGAMTVKAGAAGTLMFDAFESRRRTLIP